MRERRVHRRYCMAAGVASVCKARAKRIAFFINREAHNKLLAFVMCRRHRRMCISAFAGCSRVR